MALTPNPAGLRRGSLPVVILGNDTVLAALPAHPVQLAHACHVIGFHSVVPASWGDELIAAATMREAALRSRAPVVLCACPRVRRRLSEAPAEMDAFLFGVVSPPVAAARYVRQLFAPTIVHLTYVGACEAGSDAVFDAWLLPADLFSCFERRGVTVEAQPLTFEGVVPSDRRRHFSLPGGAPSQDALAQRDALHELIVLGDGDVLLPLAEVLLAREPRVVDAGPALGCMCAGGPASDRARAAIVSLEPPRASAPVLDARILVNTTASPRESPGSSTGTDATTPSASGDGEAAGTTLDAPRVGMAVTPAHAMEAMRATGGREGPREFWRRSALEPSSEATSGARAQDQAGSTELQQAAGTDDSPTGTALASAVPWSREPEFVVDRGTAESALRRSPSHVRRVPPPSPGRGWPVVLALLLAGAAMTAALFLLR